VSPFGETWNGPAADTPTAVGAVHGAEVVTFGYLTGEAHPKPGEDGQSPRDPQDNYLVDGGPVGVFSEEAR